MTTTPEVTQAPATIQTDDGPMPTHVAVPAGTPKGGVVVVQEAFGVTAHIQDVARRFAAAGWYAIAPAFFHRQGSPVFSYDDLEPVMPVMATLTSGAITNDVLASFDTLEAAGIPKEKTAIVGFCMGGTIAFYGATLRPIAAAVSFYGGGITEGRFGLPALLDLAPSLAAPWLGLFGDEDPMIPVDDVERLREATAKAPVESELVRYPQAGHGFHCDERPANYVPEAATDAWQRTLGWLERHAGELGPPSR